MMHLAILGSTRGTTMQALIEAIRQRTLLATIEVVISNKPQAMILERARSHGLPYKYLSTEGITRREYDEKINEILLCYPIDLILLIGYMRLLSPEFVHLWRNKILNVHPSLLPAFAGKKDTEVHQAVLDSGQVETGCTIHYVSEQVDAGPILLQKKCPVLDQDTVDTLKKKVQQLEGEALTEAIQLIESFSP